MERWTNSLLVDHTCKKSIEPNIDRFVELAYGGKLGFPRLRARSLKVMAGTACPTPYHCRRHIRVELHAEGETIVTKGLIGKAFCASEEHCVGWQVKALGVTVIDSQRPIGGGGR